MCVIEHGPTDDAPFVLITCSGSVFAQYQLVVGEDDSIGLVG